jgi:hypothetical protein
MRKIKSSILIFLLFSVIFSFSQTTVKGLITDTNNQPIPYVNVLIKSDSTNVIFTYTYSKENGNYTLKTNKKGKFRLSFSSLGYKKQTIPIEITAATKEIIKNIILTEEAFLLDEVIIQSERTIKIKKDTVEIKANSYLTENDETVEDLLKKIPGVTISSEGTIKIGNQEIEKLMIDGDDFFDKGYKILSKNMPPDQIDKIQLLQKYSNNKLLKDIEHSDKVAVNLVLKDNGKRQWFGNFTLGYDVTLNNRYSLKSYLMNFGKKNKYILLSNFNNVGYDATGDINHLIRPFRYGEPASIGDNQSAYPLLNLSSFTPNFKASRTNFNNAELVSLNAIFNPTEKLKIKTLGFLNWDEQDFFRNSTDIVTANGINFTNTENYKLRNKKTVGFGKIDFTYNISKTKLLESTTKYNSGNTNGQSDLVFNGTSTIENLKSNNTLFDQKITYSNKFKDKKVFLLTGRFIDEKTPQNYSLNQFFYQDLFPSFTNANNAQQQSKNQMQFAGFEAHLLDRKTNGDLLELQFGNEFRKDKLNTEFSLFENSTVLENPNDFQNNTAYQTNDLYLKSKYRYKINNFGITGKLGFHQLFNNLKYSDFSENQNPFFVNPSIGLDWKINDSNKINSSYSYNTTNAKILDVYNDYVLTGFRSFSKGAGSFNQLNTSTLLFNYQLGNWSDRFFANTFVFYNKNFDFFSSNTLINQNFTQSQRIVIKDREILSVSSKVDYYFKKISSNLKLDLGFSQSNYKNIVNNSNLREVTSNNYNYGLELRSGFQGVFNYHIGTKWTTNQIEASTINNSFTDNVSFLDLSFVFNDKFNIQFQTERYFFGNLDKENNTYYFLDFDARYTIKKNKLTLALTGKNLFNTETFRTFSISDISTSTTEFRLLERFVLLKLEYRF